MVEFPAVHDQILIGLRDAARKLGLEWFEQAEIEARESFVIGPTIFRGVTFFESGEELDDGVIGFEDVGYRCGCAVVVKRAGDAVIGEKRYLKRTVEALRRRFHNQRLPLDRIDFEQVKRHVLRVRVGPLTIPKEFRADHTGTLLVITAWVRETPDDGSE